MHSTVSRFAAAMLVAGALTAGVPARTARQDTSGYRQVVAQTAEMVSDPQAVSLAQKYGLQVLNLTWEDTGRYLGSCVGPNISDMTLQVQQQDPHTQQYQLTCMPVIRFPNFSDKTADLKLDDFYLLVGNEGQQSRGDLRKISLRDYLADPQAYMSRPKSWKGPSQSLLAKRDTHVLVSAQACFLPIPKHGEAQFNPVLFNYQSVKGDPAVLTLLATREGTSMTIIDNVRDGFAAGATWGQRLFFNQHGQRASLTGKRQSDFVGPVPAGPQAAQEEGLNMVLLVQVPLKQKHPMQFKGGVCCDACAPQAKCSRRAGSDVENAVIGHGKVEGPFTETDEVAIERDPNFPIRVTVQFYKATSNGVVSAADMQDIAAQLKRVYAHGEYVGSLVTGESQRPTAYTGDKHQPADWWASFWERYQANTGLTPEQARELWQRLHLKVREGQ